MTTGQDQYIQFTIGNETYAIEISNIKEIIKMQDITVLPKTKEYVKGITSLRGKVLSVISLRNLLGLSDEDYDKHTRIIVVNHKDDMVGIIVDKVNHVVNFTEIKPPVGKIKANYFVGIGILDDDLVGILNLNEVLIQQ